MSLPSLTDTVGRLLESGLAIGASDWHLDEGKKPAWRVHGRLAILGAEPPLAGDDVQGVIAATGALNQSDGDCAFRHRGELFRVSFGGTREGRSAVLRHVPAVHPSLGALGVPPRFIEMVEKREGLLLITGPTGCGKSTTLHAAIAHLNERSEGGVITILGDPIEFYHQERHCRISHREFGKDFDSWPRMLARTLRQDPDVICVSELRDADTIMMALAAAETGHLVLSTLHNGTAKDAVGRMLEASPDTEREQNCAMLTKSLRGVLAQQLVPTLDGRRVAAFELLVNTEGVANLVREKRFRQIDDEILRGRQHGMQSMDESLLQLVQGGRIGRDAAVQHARNPAALARALVRP